MPTQNTTTTTSVSKRPILGGYIETIAKTVQRTGPKTRFTFVVWVLGGAIHYGWQSYNHCKRSLFDYRGRDDWKEENEFSMTLNGLRTTPITPSLIWPWTILSQIAPSLVLRLNPVDPEWKARKLGLVKDDNDKDGSDDLQRES